MRHRPDDEFLRRRTRGQLTAADPFADIMTFEIRNDCTNDENLIVKNIRTDRLPVPLTIYDADEFRET